MSAYDFDYVRQMTPSDYVFPSDRLKRTCEAGRTPLVLVACGSCKIPSKYLGSCNLSSAHCCGDAATTAALDLGSKHE